MVENEVLKQTGEFAYQQANKGTDNWMDKLTNQPGGDLGDVKAAELEVPTAQV